MKSIRAALEPSKLGTILTLTLSIATSATSAQTWQTVDNFQYMPPNPSVNYGLVVAPSGTVFASGIGGIGGGYYQGLVMASADGGSTWSAPLDAFAYPGGANGGPSTLYDAGIASDSAGNLYVAGSAFTQPHGWMVRQGTVGGTSWATVDDIQFVSSTGQTAPHGIAVDSAGNVFVAGVVQYTNGVTAWTVRKGIGASYSTVDSFAAGGYAVAQSVVVAPNGAIFVAGHTNYTVTTKHSSTTYAIWTVRRSLDGGSTWSTVDSAIDGQPRGIGADASGNVYVVGESVLDEFDLYNYEFSVKDAPSGSHWLVRRSIDGGNSWATVDDFCPCVTTKTGTQCPFGVAANAFVADAHGNLFVAGCLRQSSNAPTQQWVVRESTGGTGAWTTVDMFQNVPNEASAPESIAADRLGNVFVGGWGLDSVGTPHWLVRRN